MLSHSLSGSEELQHNPDEERGPARRDRQLARGAQPLRGAAEEAGAGAGRAPQGDRRGDRELDAGVRPAGGGAGEDGADARQGGQGQGPAQLGAQGAHTRHRPRQEAQGRQSARPEILG